MVGWLVSGFSHLLATLLDSLNTERGGSTRHARSRRWYLPLAAWGFNDAIKGDKSVPFDFSHTQVPFRVLAFFACQIGIARSVDLAAQLLGWGERASCPRSESATQSRIPSICKGNG